MTHFKIDYMIRSIYTLLVIFIPYCLSATTYTAVVSGNWNSALTWGGNMPGNVISGEDQIIIGAGVIVNMNVDVEINNQLAIMTLLGTLESTQNDLTITAGTVAGTGELVVHELKVGAMGNVATTGNIICDVFETASTTILIQGSLHISQMLKLMAGDLQLENTGEVMLNTGATIQIEDGHLVIGDGQFQTMGSINLLYTGSSDTTGTETTVGTIANLTVNLSNSNATLTLNNGLTVTDTTHLVTGILVLNQQNLTLQGLVRSESNATIQGDIHAGLAITGNLDATITFSNNGHELDTLIIHQNGGSCILGSDLTVHQLLDIEQGELVLNGNELRVYTHLNTGAGATITTDGDATLRLDGMGALEVFFTNDTCELNTLVISQMNGNVSLHSNVIILGELTLMQGHLILADNDLTIETGANIVGGGDEHYIQTAGSGTLNIFLEAGGDGALFPVGSADGYFPCLIAQNEGASDTHIEVRVVEGVFAEGETGVDLTTSESLVDHTWLVSQADASASVDLDFEFFWQGSAAVNGFDPDNCFISHYVNGAWDTYVAAQASLDANGYFSITRDSITSLSPFRVEDQMVSAIGPPSGAYYQFKLYPNPASTHINVEVPNGLTDTVLQVFDQLGNIVLEQEVPRGTAIQSIDLNGLPAGMYLLKTNGMAGKHFVITENK